MAQNYTVASVQVVGESDEFGNQAYSVKFAEQLDAVFMKAKRAPEVGKVEYGDITQETGRSGKPYQRFKRASKDSFTGGGTSSNKPQYQPRDDMAIRAQWAIGQAILLQSHKAAHGTEVREDFVEEMAKELFAMVDRVKDSKVEKPQARDWNSLGKKEEREEDAEIKSLLEARDPIAEVTDAPINLDDIPY